jgi:hypothetical protein
VTLPHVGNCLKADRTGGEAVAAVLGLAAGQAAVQK